MTYKKRVIAAGGEVVEGNPRQCFTPAACADDGACMSRQFPAPGAPACTCARDFGEPELTCSDFVACTRASAAAPIEKIQADGDKFSVHLTDGSILGPYTMRDDGPLAAGGVCHASPPAKCLCARDTGAPNALCRDFAACERARPLAPGERLVKIEPARRPAFRINARETVTLDAIARLELETFPAYGDDPEIVWLIVHTRDGAKVSTDGFGNPKFCPEPFGKHPRELKAEIEAALGL